MTPVALTAKLVVRGADRAIAYYTEALGAELEERHADGDTVAFAQLALGPLRLQVKDEDAVDPSPATLGRPGVLLDLAVADPDAVAEAMRVAGAEVLVPVADQAYGVRQGRVRDPFGHEWVVGAARA